jgi:hypothetical protein
MPLGVRFTDLPIGCENGSLRINDGECQDTNEYDQSIIVPEEVLEGLGSRKLTKR